MRDQAHRVEKVSIMSVDVPMDRAHLIRSIAPIDMPMIIRFGGQEVLLQVGERAYLDAGTLVSGPESSTPDRAPAE